MTSRALMFVASRSTGHALPWLRASSQVLAQTHQESPGFSPGKLNCGAGVTKSLPLERANSRNSSFTIQQTVCEPLSISSVLQLPSLYQPVIGLQEHSPISWPKAFFCIDMTLRNEINTSNCVFPSSEFSRHSLWPLFFVGICLSILLERFFQ